MGKRRSLETDESALAKKVQEKIAGVEDPTQDLAARSLRKRLKRVQRKRRRLAARRRPARGENAAAPSEAAAG